MFVVASVSDNTGATEIVGPSNALYVDIAGLDDATGQRGNAARPFLTIAAALAAQTTDSDEVFLSPGTFTPAAALSIKAGLKGTTIRGSGIQTTFVNPAVNINGFDWSTVGATQASVTDLSINCSGTGKAMVGTGTGTANALMSTGLICDRVSMAVGAAGTLAIDFTLMGVVTLLDSAISLGSVSFTSCSGVTWRGTRQSGTTFLTTFDATVASTAVQNLTQLLASSSAVAAVSLTGQARLIVDATSAVSTMTGLNMSVAAGPISPSINFAGTVGAVDFTSSVVKRLPSAVLGAYTISFATATFVGASATFCVASGATRQPVDFTGTSAPQAFALTADALVDIKAQGAAFKTPTYASANTGAFGIGTIQPPSLVLTAANANPTTFTFANTLNVPTGYGVAAINSTAAGAVTAATTMSATQVITTHAAGGGNVTIVLTWP